MLHSLLLAAKSSSSTSKTTSNASSTIIFILIIGAIGYFLLIRPQRRRARAQHQTQSSIEVGDEIMLTSGIIGRVTGIEGDRAHVEIAPGIEIEVVRAAIARQVPTPVPDGDFPVEHDDAHDSHPADDKVSGEDEPADASPHAGETPHVDETPPWTWPSDGDHKGGS